MTPRDQLNARVDELKDDLAGFQANLKPLMQRIIDLATEHPNGGPEAKETADRIAIEILVNQAQIYTVNAEILLVKAELVPLEGDFDGVEIPDFMPEEGL